jgi:hypothetical protein
MSKHRRILPTSLSRARLQRRAQLDAYLRSIGRSPHDADDRPAPGSSWDAAVAELRREAGA